MASKREQILINAAVSRYAAFDLKVDRVHARVVYEDKCNIKTEKNIIFSLNKRRSHGSRGTCFVARSLASSRHVCRNQRSEVQVITPFIRRRSVARVYTRVQDEGDSVGHGHEKGEVRLVS